MSDLKVRPPSSDDRLVESLPPRCRSPVRDEYLAGNDVDAPPVDGCSQNFAASLGDGPFDAIARFRLNQEDNAPASARTAHFSCESAIAAGVLDDTIDRLGRDCGQVPFAEGPLLAHPAASFLPVWLLESHAHVLGDFGNPL